MDWGMLSPQHGREKVRAARLSLCCLLCLELVVKSKWLHHNVRVEGFSFFQTGQKLHMIGCATKVDLAWKNLI